MKESRGPRARGASADAQERTPDGGQATTGAPTSRCSCCGRTDVKKRPRYGRLMYPHKCPHGRPCPGGDPLHGVHANRPRPARLGGCPGCDKEVN